MVGEGGDDLLETRRIAGGQEPGGRRGEAPQLGEVGRGTRVVEGDPETGEHHQPDEKDDCVAHVSLVGSEERRRDADCLSDRRIARIVSCETPKSAAGERKVLVPARARGVVTWSGAGLPGRQA